MQNSNRMSGKKKPVAMGAAGFFLPLSKLDGSLHPITILPGTIVLGVAGLLADLV
jgi:hypothetical protein